MGVFTPPLDRYTEKTSLEKYALCVVHTPLFRLGHVDVLCNKQ